MNNFNEPEMEIVRFEENEEIIATSCDLCAPDCQEVGPYPDK